LKQLDGRIEFLVHLPQQDGINFVLGGDNVDDGFQSLSFRPKAHHLMERFKSQFRVVGDVESDLRGAGFGLVRHKDFQREVSGQANALCRRNELFPDRA
jgi:hypothetical protein